MLVHLMIESKEQAASYSSPVTVIVWRSHDLRVLAALDINVTDIQSSSLWSSFLAMSAPARQSWRLSSAHEPLRTPAGCPGARRHRHRRACQTSRSRVTSLPVDTAAGSTTATTGRRGAAYGRRRTRSR